MIRPLLRARSLLARFRPAALSAVLLAGLAPLAAAQTSPYNQIIIFGDSLSDVGNDARLSDTKYGIRFPSYDPSISADFDYADGRFTDSTSTAPAATTTYAGVWHEQLALRFLGLPAATDSLDGGLDYAYGGATTGDGTTTLTEGPLSIDVENMTEQVTQFLTTATNNGTTAINSSALYIVWGGANDLFADYTDANVQAAALNVATIVNRLAMAGARTFIVPNLPPLGLTPAYNTDATQSANITQASLDFKGYLNTQLDAVVAALSKQGITVDINRLDVYSLFNTIHGNAASFGFNDVSTESQNSGRNPDQSLFWDDVHPTTAGHNQIAQFAADILPGGHPAFFKGESILDSGDFAYLAFPDGKTFGYYTYQFYPYLYQTDLGFEYVIPSTGTDSGVYLYDFKLSQFLYTSPTLYPYLYDFGANSFYYYFAGTTAPRVFYDFATQQYVYSN